MQSITDWHYELLIKFLINLITIDSIFNGIRWNCFHFLEKEKHDFQGNVFISIDP